ncbi:hypothetical protein BDZ97DRAFT_130909 [Flammula alnicola]|nr:hypothetical protein BDZ97DRAFT_130909 [Flammula alnicola]
MWRFAGSRPSSPASNCGNNNAGAITETVKIGTNTATTDSFNKIIHGVGGRAAMAVDGPFYAYIHYIADDATWRIVIIFASRAVADEWWRAVSTTSIDILKDNIKRVTPQFYTHNANQWNFYNFFGDYRLKEISDKFRGKMFLVLENDRVGRGITIIPTQPIVDRASGDWFATVRSKANAGHHWYYDEALECIVVSDSQRTSFKIFAPDMHDGAIMIGVDDIILVAQHHGFVTPTVNESRAPILGITVVQAHAFKFKFRDLEEGNFVRGQDDLPSPLCYMPQGGADPGWELAL